MLTCVTFTTSSHQVDFGAPFYKLGPKPCDDNSFGFYPTGDQQTLSWNEMRWTWFELPLCFLVMLWVRSWGLGLLVIQSCDVSSLNSVISLHWGFTPVSYMQFWISVFRKYGWSKFLRYPPTSTLGSVHLPTHSPFSAQGSVTFPLRGSSFYAYPAALLDLHSSIFAVKKSVLCVLWFTGIAFRLFLSLYAPLRYLN